MDSNKTINSNLAEKYENTLLAMIKVASEDTDLTSIVPLEIIQANKQIAAGVWVKTAQHQYANDVFCYTDTWYHHNKIKDIFSSYKLDQDFFNQVISNSSPEFLLLKDFQRDFPEFITTLSNERLISFNKRGDDFISLLKFKSNDEEKKFFISNKRYISSKLIQKHNTDKSFVLFCIRQTRHTFPESYDNLTDELKQDPEIIKAIIEEYPNNTTLTMLGNIIYKDRALSNLFASHYSAQAHRFTIYFNQFLQFNLDTQKQLLSFSQDLVSNYLIKTTPELMKQPDAKELLVHTWNKKPSLLAGTFLSFFSQPTNERLQIISEFLSWTEIKEYYNSFDYKNQLHNSVVLDFTKTAIRNGLLSNPDTNNIYKHIHLDLPLSIPPDSREKPIKSYDQFLSIMKTLYQEFSSNKLDDQMHSYWTQQALNLVATQLFKEEIPRIKRKNMSTYYQSYFLKEKIDSTINPNASPKKRKI